MTSFLWVDFGRLLIYFENCRTQSEHVKNNLFENECRWNQLFSIEFQLFYFITRIIHISLVKIAFALTEIRYLPVECCQEELNTQVLLVHFCIMMGNQYFIENK
jgi:hypothetical protein